MLILDLICCWLDTRMISTLAMMPKNPTMLMITPFTIRWYDKGTPNPTPIKVNIIMIDMTVSISFFLWILAHDSFLVLSWIEEELGSIPSFNG